MLRSRSAGICCPISGLDPEEWDFPPKPKWMRWPTYNRAVEKFDKYEEVRRRHRRAHGAVWNYHLSEASCAHAHHLPADVSRGNARLHQPLRQLAYLAVLCG